MMVVRTYVEGVEDAVHKTLVADEVEAWRAKDRAEAALGKHLCYAGRAVRHETSPVRVMEIPVGLTLEAICEQAVRVTVEECGGVRSEAARVLGVGRSTVSNYLGARTYKRKTKGRGRRRSEQRAVA